VTSEVKAAIVGIAGPDLLATEAALFRAHPPTGVILFARNIQDRPQLASLMAALRRALPPHAIFMVDQEGGRVARLRPPHWRAHPAAATLQTIRRAWLSGALIGLDCAAAGFNTVAAPVLDLSIPGAHHVIGDRAFAEEPARIARLGRAFAEGLLAAGVQPIGKHAPGHGRARVDSHLSLPTVEANHLDADLLPFSANADLPWMMTAHIVYPAFDQAFPATLSPAIIRHIIRERVGFQGVLVTDDLAMKALALLYPNSRATAFTHSSAASLRRACSNFWRRSHWPRLIAVGLIVIVTGAEGGVRITVATAVLVPSATDVAVTCTDCCVVTEFGAV